MFHFVSISFRRFLSPCDTYMWELIMQIARNCLRASNCAVKRHFETHFCVN